MFDWTWKGQPTTRLVFLTFFALQYRPNHGNGNFLLAGRCAFPQLCQLPYFADLIIFQRIPQQIIWGDFQCVADIDKYRQAGNPGFWIGVIQSFWLLAMIRSDARSVALLCWF